MADLENVTMLTQAYLQIKIFIPEKHIKSLFNTSFMYIIRITVAPSLCKKNNLKLLTFLPFTTFYSKSTNKFDLKIPEYGKKKITAFVACDILQV